MYEAYMQKIRGAVLDIHSTNTNQIQAESPISITDIEKASPIEKRKKGNNKSLILSMDKIFKYENDVGNGHTDD